MLLLYFNSTYVGFNEDVLLEKSGVYIGCKVAPILSEIFLSKVDRAFGYMPFGMVEKVFKYGDDYLVIAEKRSILRCTVDVSKVFKEKGMGLTVHI
ncbi:hypothetical protein HPB48_019120 [Haemaphysalis longicornis]|uniref:Reverse transcriptase domain-containing protein n=1 Tax=Haemaphysalis longicornis TaxID=44386 RepID=A0A9J6GCQ6_HAELO|nr:hypothetical protein HPB48_019120 [Haemaphysalis longicornis]